MCSLAPDVAKMIVREPGTADRSGWVTAPVQVPPGQAALVIEMNRTSGDPVLLRKPAAGGFAAGTLPSVQVRSHTAS